MFFRILFLYVLFVPFLNYSQDQSVLAGYRFDSKTSVQFVLPAALDEISGLTVFNNRLFTHNDEDGTIFQLDYNSGQIVKLFSLGNGLISRDFEDITHDGKDFYLITSSGILYKFPEGSNKSRVDYRLFDLRISSKYDIESLCFDEKSQVLLIAGKEYAGKNYKDFRSVYSVSLNNYAVNKNPRFLISLKELKDRFRIKDFFPSAITIDKNSGHILILSAKGEPCLVELSSVGKLIAAVRLNKKLHRQPEGLAILDDGTLLISDEASGGKATLTKYFPNK